MQVESASRLLPSRGSEAHKYSDTSSVKLAIQRQMQGLGSSEMGVWGMRIFFSPGREA